jgi:hypothetical protein
VPGTLQLIFNPLISICDARRDPALPCDIGEWPDLSVGLYQVSMIGTHSAGAILDRQQGENRRWTLRSIEDFRHSRRPKAPGPAGGPETDTGCVAILDHSFWLRSPVCSFPVTVSDPRYGFLSSRLGIGGSSTRFCYDRFRLAQNRRHNSPGTAESSPKSQQ